jgi:ABC-type multidrug transport system fused ATPase/permease subunit
MKDGRIAEQGTQSELVAAGGLYSSMWREYEEAGR